MTGKRKALFLVNTAMNMICVKITFIPDFSPFFLFVLQDFYWRALLRYCLKNKAYAGCEPPSEETMRRLCGPEEERMDAEPFQGDLPSEKGTATEEVSNEKNEMPQEVPPMMAETEDEEEKETNDSPTVDEGEVTESQRMDNPSERVSTETGDTLVQEVKGVKDDGGQLIEGHPRMEAGAQEVVAEVVGQLVEDVAMEEVEEVMPELISSRSASDADEKEVEDGRGQLIEVHPRMEAGPQEVAAEVVGQLVENVLEEVEEVMPELISSRSTSATEEEEMVMDECDRIGEEHKLSVTELECAQTSMENTEDATELESRLSANDSEGSITKLQSEEVESEIVQMLEDSSESKISPNGQATGDEFLKGSDSNSKGQKKQQRKTAASLADRCKASLKDFRAQVGAAKQECELLVAKQKVKDLAKDIAGDLHTMNLKEEKKAKLEVPSGNGIMSELESDIRDKSLSSASEDSWDEEDFYIGGQERLAAVMSNICSGSVTRNTVVKPDSASVDDNQDANGARRNSTKASCCDSNRKASNTSATPPSTSLDLSNGVALGNMNFPKHELHVRDTDGSVVESISTSASKLAVNFDKQKENETKEVWDVYGNGSLISASSLAWSNEESMIPVDGQSFSRGWYACDAADINSSLVHRASADFPSAVDNQRASGIYPANTCTKHQIDNQTSKIRLPSLLDTPSYKPREDRTVRQADSMGGKNRRNNTGSSNMSQGRAQNTRATTSSSGVKFQHERYNGKGDNGHLSPAERHHHPRHGASKDNRMTYNRAISSEVHQDGTRSRTRTPDQQRTSPASSVKSDDTAYCSIGDSEESTGEFFSDSWTHGSAGGISPSKHDYTRNQGRQRDVPRFRKEKSDSSPRYSHTAGNRDTRQHKDFKTPQHVQEKRNAPPAVPHSNNSMASSRGIQPGIQQQYSRGKSHSAMDNSSAAVSDFAKHYNRGRGLITSSNPPGNHRVGTGRNTHSTEKKHVNPTQAIKAESPMGHPNPGFGRGLYKPPEDIAQRPHNPGIPRGRGGHQRGPGRGGARGRGRGRGLLATNFNVGQMYM